MRRGARVALLDGHLAPQQDVARVDAGGAAVARGADADVVVDGPRRRSLQRDHVARPDDGDCVHIARHGQAELPHTALRSRVLCMCVCFDRGTAAPCVGCEMRAAERKECPSAHRAAAVGQEARVRVDAAVDAERQHACIGRRCGALRAQRGNRGGSRGAVGARMARTRGQARAGERRIQRPRPSDRGLWGLGTCPLAPAGKGRGARPGRRRGSSGGGHARAAGLVADDARAAQHQQARVGALQRCEALLLVVLRHVHLQGHRRNGPPT